MLFNGLPFLAFLPAFSLAYFSTRGRVRLWVCLVGSCIFYAWWDWRFLGLLAVSIAVDYTLGLLLERDSTPEVRKRLVTLSIVVNLSFLGFFKYFNFFAGSLTRITEPLGLHGSYTTLHIILPVGISFYVFKTMSYTIDVYRRTERAERDLLLFATFVVFFPELVAGPIVRASRMLPQLRITQRFDYARTLDGLSLMAAGYVRKVVIADSIAPLVDVRFASPGAYGPLSLLIAVYLYAFQIYCDFSGYSDIAIGLARVFGFDFGINFARPYLAESFSGFWSRWHISLSTWLRDYLYIPLGGSRGGQLLTYRNLMLTMLLGGLWHGANWTFVVWGALHGTYLVIERMLAAPAHALRARMRIPQWLATGAEIFLVFNLTCLAWIFFRAPTFAVAWQVLHGIVAGGAFSVAAVEQKFLIVRAVILCAGLMGIEAIREFNPGVFVRRFHAENPWLRMSFVAGCLWLLALGGSFTGANFIYFQF